MKPAKRGLGRGLDALLPDTEEPAELAIGEIKPTPNQPRQHFAERELTELAYSIRLHGILQPLVVARSDDGYTLIAGERRWRAAKLAGLSHVPVYLRSAETQRHYELALIENIQRANLNPVEEARAYQQLLAQHSLTQDELAKRLGKSRSKIANGLRLLELPEPMLRDLQEGRLTAGHANALLSRPAEQRETLHRAIIRDELSVRQAEQWRPGAKTTLNQATVEPHWLRELEQSLGTKVSRRGTDTHGSLSIHYASTEELTALLERLRDA